MSLDFGRRDLWYGVRYVKGFDPNKSVVVQSHEQFKFTLYDYRKRSLMYAQQQYNYRAARSPQGRVINGILYKIRGRKTSDPDKLHAINLTIMENLGTLMDFYGNKRRRWYHWLVYVRKLQVIDDMIQSQLISKVRTSIIVYGNANFKPSFGRGYPAGPRKLLIKRIQLAARNTRRFEYPFGRQANGFLLHIKTALVNEAYSSRMCPRCFQRMKDGHGHWQLKHCSNKECPRRWQRDHAGAMNILTILVEYLKTGERPKAFCKPDGQLARGDSITNL